MIFSDLPYTSSPIAIEENGSVLDINELDHLTNQVRSIIDKKALIFCFCSNSIESIAGYMISMRTGLVPLMLSSDQEYSLTANLLKLYNPEYIWCPKDLKEKFPEGKVLLEFRSYLLLQTDVHNNADINKELALLLTTSGSTGSPKFVRLSYNNILSNAESIADYLKIDRTERPITVLPMDYSYGLSIINSHLIKGATILVTDKSVIQKEFWTFAKDQAATSISGVPYTYEMLRRLRIFNMDLPNLKTMTQAGGKLNANIAEEYIKQAEKTDKRFIVMYGQTEATARMSYLPFDKADGKYGSIGIVIPGGRFTLVDKKEEEIKGAGIDGELIYTGPNVSLGYAECRADLSRGDENKGVLHTGDIARRDEDGFYYITGRMKRFVKIYGNRVNLDTLEQIIKPLCTSCSCVGVDDKVTIFTTETEKEEAIKALLVKKTGLNNRAFDVRVIDSIPKNASGKVQYAALSKLLN